MDLDKILNKLGIYDLIAVLLPGVSITIFAVLTLENIWKLNINQTIDFSNTMILLTVGYLVGLILQETGFDIYRHCFKIHKTLLAKILHPSEGDQHTPFTLKADEIRLFVEKELKSTSIDDLDIYDYCRFQIVNRDDSFSFDKDQSLSAMSRSFACYFSISALTTLINVLISPNLLNITLTLFSIAVAILMHTRCIRFAKKRYENIFKMFYLENISALAPLLEEDG